MKKIVIMTIIASLNGCNLDSEPIVGPAGKDGVDGAPGLKGDKGEPGDAAELASRLSDNDPTTIPVSWNDLSNVPSAFPPTPHTHVDLDTRLKALEDAVYCPRLVDKYGHLRTYIPDLSVPGIVRCVFGSDEMVKVGPFWIDRFEAVLSDAVFYGPSGTCAGAGQLYASDGGGNPVDDYPDEFPDNGNWSDAGAVYACSISGHVPSRMMTWFQAQQSCVLAGKRLCRNDEWQAAVAGTPDPGASSGIGGACVTESTAPRVQGLGTACRSIFGADDMIGNLAEWVADWFAAAGTDAHMVAASGNWSSAYGDDLTGNVAGTARDPAIGYGSPLPAAAIRGGSWSVGSGSNAGAFFFYLSLAPSDLAPNVGARCCASGP